MKKLMIPTIALVALTASAFAQTPTGSEINARKKTQQERIAQGVQSGSLTAKETQKLEQQESRVNKQIRNEKAANGGNLTNNEKRQINREQNHLSSEISADKHNGAVQRYGNNEVDARRKNQQQRIAQGIASGKMSAGEAARTEGRERAINHEVHNERAANGGNLTNNEKRQVNRQLDRTSKQIHREKTN